MDLNPLELTSNRLDGHRLDRVLSHDSVLTDLTATHREPQALRWRHRSDEFTVGGRDPDLPWQRPDKLQEAPPAVHIELTAEIIEQEQWWISPLASC